MISAKKAKRFASKMNRLGWRFDPYAGDLYCPDCVKGIGGSGWTENTPEIQKARNSLYEFCSGEKKAFGSMNSTWRCVNSVGWNDLTPAFPTASECDCAEFYFEQRIEASR